MSSRALTNPKPTIKMTDSTHTNPASAETLCSAYPENLAVPLEEWNKLDDAGKQFIREADKANLMYLAENGEVCAWGFQVERGMFSMATHLELHPDDGWVITLQNVKGDAAARETLVQLGGSSPSHPPTC